MAEQINIDILINASKSAKTLKEQRKALEDLKDGLDEVKYGSGAFELLNEEAERLTQSMGNLNLRFEDVYGDIQPLTGRIGELEDRMYELALQGKQNTKEFIDLQTELVGMKRTVQDVDAQVDAFTERGRGITQVVDSVAGLVSVFNIAQGAVALFGEENEQLEKTLVKLNAGMAILQGIQEISNQLTKKGTILNKAYNLVLKANPVFLLVTVLTAVVAIWEIWNNLIDDSVEKQKDLNAQLEEFKRLQEENLAITKQVNDYNVQILELEGSSLLEIYNLKVQLSEQEEEIARDTYNANYKRIQALRNAKDEDLIEERKKLEEENKALKQKLAVDETFLNSFGKQRVLLEKQYNKEVAEAQQELSDKLKESNQKRIEELKILRDNLKETYKVLRVDVEDLFGGQIVEFGEDFNRVFQKIRDNLTDTFPTSTLEEYTQILKETLDSDEIKNFGDEQRRQIVGLVNGYKVAKEELEAFGFDAQKTAEVFSDLMDVTADKMKVDGEVLFREIDGVISRLEPKFDKALDVYEEYNNYVEQLVMTISKNKNITITEAQELVDNYQKIFREVYILEDTITGFVFNNLEKRKIAYDKYTSERRKVEDETALIRLDRELEENLATAKNFRQRRVLLEEYIKNRKKLLEKEKQDALEILRLQYEEEIRNQELTEKERQELYDENQRQQYMIYQKYVQDKLKLEMEFDDKVKEGKSKLAKFMSERETEVVDAIQQQLSASLTLLDSIYTTIEDRRISFIQQESDLRLAAIDAEKNAYLDSITQQTNAEKFKSAKLKEFDDKAAIEQKERDKQIAEAQYKGEIRKWEYSYLEAIVNLGKSLLGAAANPFQLGVVAALGVTQLATIQANKPNPPQFGSGGMITGPSHSGGGVDINAEGGEVIINKKSSSAFLPLLDSINQAYGGTPLMSKKVMATGGMVAQQTMDTSRMESLISELVNRPIKTYVVSSDMTQQQKSDNVLKNRTTF